MEFLGWQILQANFYYKTLNPKPPKPKILLQFMHISLHP